MRPTARTSTNELLMHRLQRRQWIAAAATQHDPAREHEVEMLARLVLLGILATACLVLAWGIR